MFDTNVVLDLLVFDDAAARPLLDALSERHVRCVATEATLKELRRVLSYPEFALEEVRQAAIVERYEVLTVRVGAAAAPENLPRCSDPDDQKFLELAAAARANVLVSKDRALLKLRRRCAVLFQILTPVEAVSWLKSFSQDQSAET